MTFRVHQIEYKWYKLIVCHTPQHVFVGMQIVAIGGLTEGILPWKRIPVKTSTKSTTYVGVAVFGSTKTSAFVSIDTGPAHLVRGLRLLFEFTPSLGMKQTLCSLHHCRILYNIGYQSTKQHALRDRTGLNLVENNVHGFQGVSIKVCDGRVSRSRCSSAGQAATVCDHTSITVAIELASTSHGFTLANNVVMVLETL